MEAIENVSTDVDAANCTTEMKVNNLRDTRTSSLSEKEPSHKRFSRRVLSYFWLAVFISWLTAWIQWENRKIGLTVAAATVVGISLFALAVRFREVALTVSWFLFGAILVFIWLFNSPTPWEHKLFAFSALCYVFFVLEGTELAYTELRDKDPEQLPKILKEVIKEINQDKALFYDSREMIIVLLVVLVTIWSDYEKISIPIVGETSERRWTLGFSLVFSSVLIIWFAQGPSKQLATFNSVGF